MMSTEIVAVRMGAPANVARALEETCIKFGISSTLQKSHFLGQMAVESQNFTKVVENMNYTAKRMAQVWPSRYATSEGTPNAKAIALAKAGPVAIANDVYGKRMGNRAPGDGWMFRGQGFKMITGRSNVTAYSMFAYGDDRVARYPAMLQRLPDAAYSGGWFWTINRIGVHADKDDALAVGRLVNIGRLNTKLIPIGHAQRVAATNKAKQLFRGMVR